MMKEMGRRRILWIELGIVVLWLVVPPLVTQLLPRQPGTGTAATTVDILRAVTKLGQICALLFLMWQSGDGLKSFGIVRDRFWRVLAIAGGLMVVNMAIETALARNHILFYPKVASFERRGVANTLVVLLTTALNCSSEELMFRSYLFTRLEELLNNRAFALTISFVAFASMHLYQGVNGFIGAGLIGLCLGIAFIRFRSILPLALAHMLTNLFIFFSY